MKRNIQQHKRMYGLFSKLAIKPENRHEMVLSFSNQRTEHTSELTADEAEQLIFFLEKMLPAEQALDKDERANQMRRKILACAHQMGWYKRNEGGKLVLSSEGKPTLDWAHIDNFCLAKSPSHKPLQQHSYTELVPLVAIFKKVLKSHLNNQ